MIKTKEDKQFVWYKFELDISIKTSTVNGKGRPVYEHTQKHGLFKFNKIEDLQENSIELVSEKTDEYFFVHTRPKFACLQQMNGCKKINMYPDVVEFASC